MVKKVCFVPATVNSNKYVDLMRKAIKQAGYDVSESNSFVDVLKCDIVHFNWYEGIPGGNRVQQVKAYLIKMLTLLTLKILRKKIVFTMHNKLQHDKSGADLSKRLMVWLLKNSDSILMHCSESYKVLNELVPCVNPDKMKYVPHPNYIGTYPDEITYSGYEKKKGEIVLLFMGQVKPYKNVESVIYAANILKNNSNIKFLICGKCSSEEYKQQLLSQIDSENVNLDLRFIKNEEVPSLMELADVVILPYKTGSSLNSGAAYLAFSYGKTVVSTEIGTINDMLSRGLVYSYKSGADEEEDAHNLVAAIEMLIRDISEDSDSISKKGYELYKIMEEENSISSVADALRKLYE